MRGRNLLILLALGMMLGACAPKQQVNIAPPPPPQVYVPPAPKSVPQEGSLYAGQRAFFFEDHRASRVGDVITIKIVETYQSSNKVSNKISRSSETSAGVKSLLGFEKVFEESNPRFKADPMFSGGMSTKTDGQGQFSRNTNIVATLTARVIDVLPNGNLVIQGVRTIRQDENLEYLTITGIVRPEDVAADNSVLSTQISDARIEYSGAGPNTLAVRGPGWLSRALQVIWPF
ncbi:flagellar basal body L-ring protein FlgH [Thermodesulfatator atlanticus]|uniref:flagellar basal body L-ring protein FlgH n=1 Tax=Thermodesulfatator atlanticus TaxID=501497 RepID=UPI0003B64804|nr:flagellar basal body L-ring protein FlgH [Thermodesulfatator atlanticus]